MVAFDYELAAVDSAVRKDEQKSNKSLDDTLASFSEGFNTALKLSRSCMTYCQTSVFMDPLKHHGPSIKGGFHCSESMTLKHRTGAVEDINLSLHQSTLISTGKLKFTKVTHLQNPDSYQPNQRFVFLCFLLLLFGEVYSQEDSPKSNVTLMPPMRPPTARKDKRALLAIKKALGLTEYTSWNRKSDPCSASSRWSNVACTCDPFNASFAESERIHCDNYITRSASRVIYVEIKRATSEENPIRRSIPRQVGDLRRLRWLSLEDNDLEGEIPDSFRNLRHLRYLSLAQNRLSGTVPEFFNNYQKLMTLYLHQNNFSGELPASLCSPDMTSTNNSTNQSFNATVHHNSSNRSIIASVHHNYFMCGMLPECLRPTPNLNGTYLYVPANDSSQTHPRCDTTEPICDEDINGCRLSVPKYWIKEDNITFNYTNFTDPETGIYGYTFNIIRVVNATSNDSFTVGRNNTVEYKNVTVKLKNGENFSTVETMVQFNATKSEKSLVDGQRYMVQLTARNNGGPPRNHTVLSAQVLVDRSPPVIEAVYNHEKNEKISTFSDQMTASASWIGLADLHSNISQIEVFLEQVKEQRNGDGEYTVVAHCNESFVNSTSCTFYDYRLRAGRTYRVKLNATNGVGLSAQFNSTRFTVYSEDSNGFLGLGLGVFITLLCFAVFVLAALLKIIHMVLTRDAYEQVKRFRADHFLKELVYEVSDSNSTRPNKYLALDFDSDVAFVITDIENSTGQAEANKYAYQRLLEIHNKLMRDALNEYCGFEIRTEGDSFSVAFPTVVLAMCFALKIQDDFVKEHWPRDVLLLPNCSVVKNTYGDVVFRGPRIRIGLHWAKRPGITSRIHHVTGHRIFVGHEYDLVRQIADAGNGGQIVLTHQAWLELYPFLSQCKFPTISQIGYYTLTHSRVSQPLYDVTCCIGESYNKHFPALRRVNLMAKGRGVSIIPFPNVEVNEHLTFVALIMKFHSGDHLPQELAEQVYYILASRAQLFQGAIIRTDITKVRMLLVFEDPLNAIRFAHIIQLSLVLMDWPKEMLSFSGPEVSGEKDIPLFNGPRVATAIHTTNEFRVREANPSEALDTSQTVQCEGPGEEFVRRVSEALDGGQIVLTELAWTRTQNNLPGQYHIIDHGRHRIHNSDKRSTQLVELTPLLLKGRNFRAIESDEQIEKGYYEAPDIQERLAILSVQVCRENWNSNLESAFREALEQFNDLVRRLLPIHGGYECRHLDPGEFILAFKGLQDAIVFACELQSEMHCFEWKDELLQIEEFGIRRCNRTNRIVKRGLIVKAAVAFGFSRHKELMDTGRANYSGALLDLSSNLLVIAKPGQILVHSETGLDSCGIRWMTNSPVGILPLISHDIQKDRANNEIAIEIQSLGDYLVRGSEDLKSVYQAKMLSMARMDDETRTSVMSHLNNRNGGLRNGSSNWLQSVVSRIEENYQRLLHTSSFTTSRGGGNRFGRASRRQIECCRDRDGRPNGMLRSSPSTLGTGFRLASEIELRNDSQPSSSGSQPLEVASNGVL